MKEHHCPVCGMYISAGRYAAEHLGVTYSFCSHQCKENFLEHPGLYAGFKTAKKQGKEILKRRKFRLDHTITAEQADMVVHALEHLMGVQSVKVHDKTVEIIYDLLQCKAKQVEHCLVEVGAKFGTGWADRMRLGWILYTEENELDHLEADAGSCCNRSPGKS